MKGFEQSQLKFTNVDADNWKVTRNGRKEKLVRRANVISFVETRSINGGNSSVFYSSEIFLLF